LNANTQRLDTVPSIGSLCVTQHEYPSTTLQINIAAGSFVNAAGAYMSFGGQTGFPVAASATTNLWLTDTGLLASGAAWPAPGTNHVRLATVSSGATSINAIADCRTPFRSASS
jgi:hypothetical protein